MKLNRLSTIAICLLMFVWVPTSVLAQDVQQIEGQKIAQTGMKFLSQSVGARAAALSGATTALEEASSVAMFYNPAAMARMEKAAHVGLSRVQWIGDINYNAASIAFRPSGGNYGTVGLSLMAVDYGQFYETVRAGNQAGFIDVGSFSPSALALGLGYARALTDRFAVGGNIKYAHQDLGASIVSIDEGGTNNRRERSLGTLAFDFGVQYATGFRGLIFAVNARNFSKELVYVEENFELPLMVTVGLAADLFEMAGRSSKTHELLLSLDASHPRDYPEQVKVGGEYQFMDLLTLRAGYTYPHDEQGVSLGAGLHTGVEGFDFQFDYAYTQFGRFGNINRLSIAVGL